MMHYELVKGNSWNPFKRRYRLTQNYSFEFMGAWFYIDKGYEWDGPTAVPIIPWVTEGWLEPSLVHDYLYEFWPKLTQTHPYTQEDVDDKFVYDLGKNGVTWPMRFVVDKFYRRVFAQYWEETEPVKISLPIIRDIVIALIFTAVFAFFYFKTQSVFIELFLGLFGE